MRNSIISSLDYFLTLLHSSHLVNNITEELHTKLAGDGKAIPHSVFQG